MLGIIYIVLSTVFGYRLSSRFFGFRRMPERLASGFLVGIVLSTWTTFLVAAAVRWPFNPLTAGNIVFLVVAATTVFLLRRRQTAQIYTPEPKIENPVRILGREFERENFWDAVTIGLMTMFVTWMMFVSLGFQGEMMSTSYLLKADMSANLSMGQMFVHGSGFPTEYPLFSGAPIRIHFLFWFQEGNLYYLGLHPVWGVNLLSIFSLVSLLVMIISLGESLFSKRWVGRLAAFLFFFHGSLAYMHSILANWNWDEAAKWTIKRAIYLGSGFAYAGEDWGLWTMNVYINQRHLITAIGILAVLLAYRVNRESDDENAVESVKTPKSVYAAYALSGLLVGLMPLWNGPIFLSGMLIFGVLLIFWRERLPQLVMLITAGVVALPQILYLRPETTASGQSYPMLSWGFNVSPPTILNVVEYIGVTFGFKLVLIAIALVFLHRLQRSFFIAVTSLLVLAFTVKFSFEVLTNHKFLNIWLVFVNLFAAYGAYRLWEWSRAGKALAVVLLLLIIPGGIVDLFPLQNADRILNRFDEEPLAVWLIENTPRDAVFLTEHYAEHPILFAGRRFFQGFTYFTAAAGYPADARGAVYREMLTTKDPARLATLLRENGIDYVAYDNSLRNSHFKGEHNEAIYKEYFPLVYGAEMAAYDDIKIYKIGEPLRPLPEGEVQTTAAEGPKNTVTTRSPTLLHPRGITTDDKGNYYVGDTGNSLVQKFDADGKFVSSFGDLGRDHGQITDPNGIAVAADGTIWVADAANNKILKFGPAGNYLNEWLGPEGGFYGPRDVSLGPNNMLYIVDQGRTRIAVFDTKTEQFEPSIGNSGTGEGKFNEATGIAIGSGLIFVCDTGNERIEAFDLAGKFVRAWPVPEWVGFTYGFPDLVWDDVAKRLYVTSNGTKEILVYDIDGKQYDSIKPQTEDQFDSPASLAISETKSQRRLLVLNNGSSNVVSFELEAKKK